MDFMRENTTVVLHRKKKSSLYFLAYKVILKTHMYIGKKCVYGSTYILFEIEYILEDSLKFGCPFRRLNSKLYCVVYTQILIISFKYMFL